MHTALSTLVHAQYATWSSLGLSPTSMLLTILPLDILLVIDQYPTLTSIMVEELKAFAVRQAKLRLRWDLKPGWEKVFAAACLTAVPGFGASSWLLPGGEDVLLMHGSKEITLRRVMLSNVGASLERLAHTSLNLPNTPLPAWKQLFYDTVPHPLLAVWDRAQRYCFFVLNQPSAFRKSSYTITVPFASSLSTKRRTALTLSPYSMNPCGPSCDRRPQDW